MPLSTSLPTSSEFNVPLGPAADPPHGQGLEFTQRVFGSPPSQSRELDPETGEEYFIVTVTVDGPVDEIVAANDRWHRGLLGAAGESAHRYRLSLNPQ